MRPCMGCELRRIGCHADCPAGKAQERENAAKKAYIRKHNHPDAYEVYGLTRTGCCGCPISYKAVDDLELIRPYEPTLVKAAWNVFGKSYRYRQQYNEYKHKRMARKILEQIIIDDFEEAGK